MKSRLLKIIPFLFGLFLVGVSFGSFASVAQAGTTTCVPNSTCIQWSSYTTTCTGTTCSSYTGPYACASNYNLYGAGNCWGTSVNCGTTNVGYCCPYYYSCTKTSCAAYGQTCTYTPSYCPASSGTLYWGAGCSAYKSQPSTIEGGVASVNNTNQIYTTDGSSYDSFTCSTSGTWVQGNSPCIAGVCASPLTETQTLSCPTGQLGSITQTHTKSAYPSCSWGAWTTTSNTCYTPVVAPTTASITVSPNPVPPNGTFAVTLFGTNTPTYYDVWIVANPSSVPPTYPSWPASNSYVPGATLPAGTYPLSVRACNTAGCSGIVSGGTLVVQAPLPAPVSAWVSATPNPVTANQTYTATWGATYANGGNCTDCSYTLNVNGGAVVPPSGMTSWTLSTPPDGVGTYIVSVQACNSSGCVTSQNYTLTVTPAVPAISSFTANGATKTVNLSSTGGSVTLSWSAFNVTSCTVSGGSLGATGISFSTGNDKGSYTIPSVTSPATYTINCR